MKYAFYPGCSAKSTSKEYEESTKAISKVLGLELVEISDWNCCGSIDAVYSYKPMYSIALAAKKLGSRRKNANGRCNSMQRLLLHIV